MNENSKTGLTVTLIAISSILCGALLCLAVWIIGRLLGYDYDTALFFMAYLSGSIGFLLTAPVNIILPILRKHDDCIVGTVKAWSAVTIALCLLACAVGIILMFVFKWTYGVVSPTNMATQFISGSFLLLISGGIYWLFNRKNRK